MRSDLFEFRHLPETLVFYDVLGFSHLRSLELIRITVNCPFYLGLEDDDVTVLVLANAMFDG